DTETDPVVGAVTGIVKADGAGTISAAVAGTDYDPSSTNELQDLSITGDVLTITGITTPTEIDLSGYDQSGDIGNRTYTEENYVTDGQTVTASIDNLDMEIKDNADAISSLSVDNIHDADNDTKVTTENAADEDYIRFFTDGSERGNISKIGNVWFDKELYLGGGLHIQESGSDVMNVDGTSGNVWTAGDLYFNNQKSIWASPAVGPAQKVITFRDGSDNMIIHTSPAPGNNLYIKDDEGDNIIQFSGGTNELTFAFGSIVDGEAGTNNIGSGANPFNAVYVDNMVRWNDDDATTISAASLGGASSALYIGNRKILVYGEQGSNWWDGSGAPGAGTGDDGDYYLNNDNSDYYYKSSGSWTLKGNLRGTGWFSGDGNPVDTIPGLYKAGDLWFNTEAGTEAEGEYWTYDGTSWSATAVGDLTGPRGSRGEAGASILTGLGAPDWDLGLEGDYYIDTTSSPTEHHRYLWGPKPSDTNWPTSYSVDLVGPAGGRTIHNGTVDPTSGDGIDGDFWINTTTNYIWGPKASGAWPSSGVSLVGPIGPEGPTGPRGYGLAYRWDGTKLWVKVDSSGADSSYSDLQGPAGPAGPQGPAGTGLTNRGAWVSGTTDYVESDYVFDESSGTPGVNSMWICQSDVDSPPYDTQPKDDPTHWVEFEAPPGEDGQDAYVYIAYADADDGTGFTNTFDPTKDYIAILSSDSLISSPIATDFDGLWKKYRGAQGIQGIQGDNAYVYIAYAGNASGAGFTMTFDSTLNYIAILDTNEEITPVASDFDGLWKNYKGPEGIQGDVGVGLNYLWDGTKLGVKREDEDSVEYDYVDLLGPVAGSANQVVYKNASNVATGSDNLQFDGNDLYVGGDIYVHNNSIHLSDGTNAVTLSAPTITADRAIAFPDNSGTVALTTDIPGSQDLSNVYQQDGNVVTLTDGHGDIQFKNDDTVPDEILFLDESSGYIGMGMTAPIYKLDIYGNGSYSAFRAQTGSGGAWVNKEVTIANIADEAVKAQYTTSSDFYRIGSLGGGSFGAKGFYYNDMGGLSHYSYGIMGRLNEGVIGYYNNDGVTSANYGGNFMNDNDVAGVTILKYGVSGKSTGTNGIKYGVYGEASGTGVVNYGVYGTASGATENWAGYFEGNVNITGQITHEGTNNTNLVFTDAATVDRTITFPDASGTVALTSDIPGSQDLQGAYDEGADIVVAAGTPVTMTSSGSGNVALEVTAGAARGIQAINDATNNAAVYARNDGTGPAIYSSGDLRMSGTSGTKIYSTADINVQLDEGGGSGTTNNFNILDDAETVVFTVDEGGNVTAGTWQGSAIGDAYIPASITRDSEWDDIAEIEAATGVDIITSTENNDAADDLSDNDLTDIGDVAGPPADGKILKYNGTAGIVGDLPFAGCAD
ncbi:hypothetical protein J7L01_07570, partial [bacterium]|nr:hypothetical protein [bacterium]